MIDNNDNDDYQNPHNYYSSPDFGFFLLFLFFPLFLFFSLSYPEILHRIRNTQKEHTYEYVCEFFFSLCCVV